jgi:glycogen(starch) synthase
MRSFDFQVVSRVFILKLDAIQFMAEVDLLECSFEVGNKVGGIHQVLESKSGKMENQYGEKYLTVGYYDEGKAVDEFIPRENPYSQIFSKLEEEGIECYYGVWNVKSRPRTILVDASGLEKDVDDIKEEYWERFGIDSINAGQDFDEPLKWGYAVSRLVQELEKKFDFVTHFHEWLSGAPVFHIDSPTAFTCHATVLGRAISNSGRTVSIEDIEDPDGLAENLGVKAKHQLEKKISDNSDFFTTVSEVTGREAENILDKEPDKILPNGFNTSDYPGREDLSLNHVEKKKDLKRFLRAYFEPYYSVDLDDDPRIFFTSGRYEFHNKGYDLLIEALGELNREKGDEIFFFFFVPADSGNPKKQLLNNKSMYNELEEFVDSHLDELKNELLDSVTSNEDPSEKLKDFFDSEKLESLNQNFHRKEGERPPLSAFNLRNENDRITSKLREEGLLNREDDRVKVVFYPTYLSVGDQLLSLDYEDAVRGCSAGIFPSFYEPWGYTPVETAANGALAVTSDFSGFGQYLCNQTDSSERNGIRVLERSSVDWEESRENLAEILEEFNSYEKAEITERKHNARKLAELTSWEKLAENYREIHEEARENL